MFLAESSIQLVPDGTLLLHFLFVGLMVVVLSRTLLKPINVILREREEYVRGRKDKAKAMAAAREEMLQRYETEFSCPKFTSPRSRIGGHHSLFRTTPK